MLLRHAPAILLDVVDLQERDRIVAFLTAEHGKKRGVARGARTKFSRFAGQLQPLAKVQVGWSEKDGRELGRISEVQLVRSASPLQEDLEGILLGAYMAEHMTELVMEDEDSAPFFRLLDTTLEALLGGIDRQLAVRYFEIWALRLSGVLPVPRECPFCGQPFEPRAALLESEGALVCAECAEGHTAWPVGREELDFLVRSGRENLASLAANPPDVKTLKKLEEVTGRARRHFLQAELRSYRVMRDTLA